MQAPLTDANTSRTVPPPKYDFRCRRKLKCSGKPARMSMDRQPNSCTTLAPTGNQTQAAVLKGEGTTTAPTRPPSTLVLLFF